MKKIILIVIICLCLIGLVEAANWQEHPEDCPVEYNSVSCTGGTLQCGIETPGPYCYDMSLLNPPGSDDTSDAGDTYQSGLAAGFIVNCEATDAAEPYCDNSGGLWCNRNNTCYTTYKRKSTCKANKWANESPSSECSTCRTGYTYCDGDYEDSDGCEVRIGITNCAAGANNNINSTCDCVCDSGYLDCDASGPGTGNGCEVQNGGSCSIAGLPGTYDGCNCEIDKSYFETGTQANYSSIDPLLWGVQFGTGLLMNLSYNYTGWTAINRSGCVLYSDGTSICSGNISSKWTDEGDYIQPDSTFADNVMISGWLNVTSWLKVWADTIIYGDLNVTENLYVTGNISGDMLFVSSAMISGNANISGNATITGNADISGDANVSGNQSLAGDLTIGGKVSDDNSSSFTYFDENGTFRVHLET